MSNGKSYQTHSPPATPHRLQNPNYIAVVVIFVTAFVVHVVVVIILVDPRNVPLKFGQNRVSNS